MNQQWDEIAAEHALADMLGVVKLGRREYAVSLIWNRAEGGRSLLNEARETAVRVESSLIALRPAAALWPNQYALGDPLLGHKPGQPSLATAIAEQVSGSLFGVWQLESEIWCLIGVRSDGSIVYDRTVGVGQETAIRTEFEEGLIMEAWEQVICPRAWGIAGSQASEETSPLVGRSKVRLRALKANVGRKLVQVGGLALVVAGLWFGYHKFQQLRAERQEIPVIVAAPEKPAEKPPEKLPEMPWVGQPVAGEMLTACVDGLLLYAYEATGIPGWSRQGGHCDGKNIHYDIARTTGTDGWVAPMAQRLLGPPIVSGPNQGKATLSWPLPSLTPYAKGSPGTPVQATQTNLQAQFDEMFIPITFSAGDNQRFWKSVRFTLNVTRLPTLFMPLIGTLPGTVLNEVSFNPDTQSWTMSGLIYERL